MNLADAARQIRGAFRLGQRDPSGLADLDPSIDGYWRSFGAALLVLPAYAVMVAVEPRPIGDEPLAGLLANAIAYVVFWTCMPVAMLHVCRALGRERNYTTYVVADNWAQIPQAYLMAVVSLIGLLDVLPDAWQAVMGMAAILWILLFKFWVARITLAISAAPALGVVVLDVVLGLVIGTYVNHLGG